MGALRLAGDSLHVHFSLNVALREGKHRRYFTAFSIVERTDDALANREQLRFDKQGLLLDAMSSVQLQFSKQGRGVLGDRIVNGCPSRRRRWEGRWRVAIAATSSASAESRADRVGSSCYRPKDTATVKRHAYGTWAEVRSRHGRRL